MTDIDKTSALLLDVVWQAIDVKGTGYVYGRDFSLVVSKMEEILNKGRSGSERATLVSKTGEEILKKFSSDQEFFKVYKEDFCELFNGLIGTSFRNAVQRFTGNGSLTFLRNEHQTTSFYDNEKTPVDSEALREEVLALKRTISELQKWNSEKEHDISSKNEVLAELRQSNGSPSGSPMRKVGSRTLEAQVATLKEELNFKDGIIREKDRELLSMTEKLEDFKNKYEFLERGFQFYKDHGELQKPEAIKEATKHEFIISELRRKIQDQSELIGAMRTQVESRKVALPAMREKSVEASLPDLFSLSTVLKYIVGAIFLVLAINILLYSMAFLKSLIKLNPSQELNSKIKLKWWEQSSVLSKVHWFFTDFFEYDWDPASDEVLSANYDKLFGV
ncbi:LANO_0E04280g1_1 [Lachancea nothofagi CBS 11611]|uniref:Monopolar spindle protein 2 n=1 Tax=Lachancea nothofagi CBS 11611 TaxID=1266666 RepID=A0A1G4JRV9_9SACH|nr:LANO_0E04280g1_1 [Lachancea nothofagi CBS 11611]